MRIIQEIQIRNNVTYSWKEQTEARLRMLPLLKNDLSCHDTVSSVYKTPRPSRGIQRKKEKSTPLTMIPRYSQYTLLLMTSAIFLRDVRYQDVSCDVSDSTQDDEKMVLIEMMTKIGETKMKNQTCNEKDTTKD